MGCWRRCGAGRQRALFALRVYIVIVYAINLVDGIDGLAGGFDMSWRFAWWFGLLETSFPR